MALAPATEPSADEGVAAGTNRLLASMSAE
jgi:hypothetical protein